MSKENELLLHKTFDKHLVGNKDLSSLELTKLIFIDKDKNIANLLLTRGHSFDTVRLKLAAYRKKTNQEKKSFMPDLSINSTAQILNEPEELKHRIKDYLKRKQTVNLAELSDHFDTGITKIKEAVESLIEGGHTLKMKDNIVYFSQIIPKSDAKVLNVEKMSTGFYRFGVVGDNHLGSRYERLDVLNALYDIFEKEGIKRVFNTGNYIDGEARFNKHDLKVHGLDGQINYFLENYPKKEGIVTDFITGDDHEGWYTQREGIDVGAYTQMRARKANRMDLNYLGHMEADIILPAKNGKTTLRILHPGGGSSYAISYTAQKIVESYTSGEKPDILFLGHYHKAEYGYIRGVHTIQTGCTQDQTPFMRKKRLAAHLGGWIIEFAVDDNGAITRFKQEFIPFYDNSYYEQWSYKW